MPVTSFNVDAQLDQTLEDLKVHYRAASKAEVLRKAVALLKLVQENEQTDGSFMMRDKESQEMKVLVR